MLSYRREVDAFRSKRFQLIINVLTFYLVNFRVNDPVPHFRGKIEELNRKIKKGER
jgi:hypothetical protein